MTAPLPIFAEIGPITITSHALAFVLGVLLSGWIFARLLRGRFGSGWLVWERVAWVFIAGIAGARLFYLLAYPDEWRSLLDFFRIWAGGLVSFGGILAGLAAALWLVRKEAPAERQLWLSSLVLAALPGWALGRVGNYLMGEAAGLPATFGLLGDRVPVALLEAALCLLLFAKLFYFRRRLNDQQIIVLVLFGYFLVRFGVDFWRDEPVYFGLRLSQWVSLAALGLLLVGLKHAVKTVLLAARSAPGPRRRSG